MFFVHGEETSSVHTYDKNTMVLGTFARSYKLRPGLRGVLSKHSSILPQYFKWFSVGL